MELKIMKASLLALAVVLAAMVASPAFAKTPHPECAPNYAGKIPPEHEKHGEKFCDGPRTTILNKCPETLDNPQGITWVVQMSPEGRDLQWRAYEVAYGPYMNWQTRLAPASTEPFTTWHPVNEPALIRMEFRAMDASGNVDPTPAVCEFVSVP
jgi:hypothetical protein